MGLLRMSLACVQRSAPVVNIELLKRANRRRGYTPLNTTGDDTLAEWLVSQAKGWRLNDGQTGEVASRVTLRPEG